MKILATFDGSKSSEAILPHLRWMAQILGAEFTFFSVARRPHETSRRQRLSQPVVAGMTVAGATPITIPLADPQHVEDLGQAIDRALAERSDYLRDLVLSMPPGPTYHVEVSMADHVAAAIIQYAMKDRSDVIVMGTHGETGMIHRLFGDIAEEVVRSGVAPVLLVHPDAARAAAREHP